MISNDDIRREFIAAGFTIKDGCDDLKPYVYEAARRVLALAAAEVARAVAAERDRWTAETVSIRVDAKRYRKLRAQSHYMTPIVSDPFEPGVTYLPEGLDAAIDALPDVPYP